MGWKLIDPHVETGFLDKNGEMIHVGDKIIYMSRSERHRATVDSRYRRPTEDTVTGFGRAVKRTWEGAVVSIEYINIEVIVRTKYSSYVSISRIYRPDKTAIVK